MDSEKEERYDVQPVESWKFENEERYEVDSDNDEWYELNLEDCNEK